MDNVTLKKKLSTFLTGKGYLKNVSDEVLFELLIAWENWNGPSKEFYSSLGFSYPQMAGLLGKAKKMKRDGVFGDSEFREVLMQEVSSQETPSIPGYFDVEVIHPDGKIIRFTRVEILMEYLKKAG